MIYQFRGCKLINDKNDVNKIFWEIFSKQDRQKIDEFQKYMDKFAVNFNLYKDGNFIEKFTYISLFFSTLKLKLQASFIRDFF